MSQTRLARFTCAASPNFELLLALWQATGEPAGPHRSYLHRMKGRAGAEFRRNNEAIGGCAPFWLALFDLPAFRQLDTGIGAITDAIRQTPPREFAASVFSALLHSREATNYLLARGSLREALNFVTAKKREWLMFVGLYPARPGRERGELPGAALAPAGDVQGCDGRLPAAILGFRVRGFLVLASSAVR